jgi:hypothetical protein
MWDTGAGVELQGLAQPVLLHCSADIGRTGKAGSYVKRRLAFADSSIKDSHL